jgi:CRP-like cAMP-binding protein
METNCWNIFPIEYINDLKKISRNILFHKGDLVFQEEDMFKGFYLVHSGVLKLNRISYQGKESILKIAEHGHLIGVPFFLVGDTTYPISLEALEYSSLYYFEKSITDCLIQKFPVIRNILMTISLKYLLYLQEKTISLMQDTLNERLLKYLSEIGARENYIKLTIKKNQIALLLNASPEAISRSFRFLTLNNQITEKDETYKIEFKS